MIAAAPHHAASLNANYYITIAAVIPTLFIAIGVQGDAFVEVAQIATTVARPFARGAAGLIKSHTGLARFVLRAVGYLYGAVLVLLAGAGLLLAGLAGEGIALWVLFSGKDNVVFRVCTLAAAALLVIAAGLQPVRTLSKPLNVLFKVATARPSTADTALQNATSRRRTPPRPPRSGPWCPPRSGPPRSRRISARRGRSA